MLDVLPELYSASGICLLCIRKAERSVRDVLGQSNGPFHKPQKCWEIENASGIGEVGNASCGDIMRIYLKIEDNIIKDIKFKTFGCGAAIATSSMVTELVKGKTVEEALEVTNKAVADALDGLPPIKMHCSNLAADALHAAIKDYQERKSRRAS